ncbi:uncharacterized protein [Muntiacus reevesi]|uniref:uncharacterized protein isoform X2 n=1 Tax=Muntiacus reevesi TaxID=9886 RepID=UPI0033075317
MEELCTQSQKCRDELFQLNHTVLQLGEEASTHQAQSKKNHITIQLLTRRVEEAELQQELQGNEIQKLELELDRVTQERQSLRLAQSQLREALEKSQDQVGVHRGPGLKGVSLASDRLLGTRLAKGVTGLAEVTRLRGRPPGPGLSQAPSRVRWNTRDPCEGLCLFAPEGRSPYSSSGCALCRWRSQGARQVGSEAQAVGGGTAPEVTSSSPPAEPWCDTPVGVHPLPCPALVRCLPGSEVQRSGGRELVGWDTQM